LATSHGTQGGTLPSDEGPSRSRVPREVGGTQPRVSSNFMTAWEIFDSQYYEVTICLTLRRRGFVLWSDL
jgi:hypothetical protein